MIKYIEKSISSFVDYLVANYTNEQIASFMIITLGLILLGMVIFIIRDVVKAIRHHRESNVWKETTLKVGDTVVYVQSKYGEAEGKLLKFEEDGRYTIEITVNPTWIYKPIKKKKK